VVHRLTPMVIAMTFPLMEPSAAPGLRLRGRRAAYLMQDL